MSSTTPAEREPAEPARPAERQPGPAEPTPAAGPMRALLASCKAAAAVCTPPSDQPGDRPSASKAA
jgi:hypothetical protein